MVAHGLRMRSFAFLTLLLVAGCPPKKSGGPFLPAASAGCPTASGVHVASHLTAEPGAKGHTGWVLPLFDKTVETLDGVADYATLDAATATAAGVPAPPTNLWLMVPNAQPCKVGIGSYYAAAIDAPTKNIAYGVELSGCPAPQQGATDATAIVLVSDDPPSACGIVTPKPIAERLGDLDKDGKWSRPTKQTPIPEDVAAAIPARECAAPACEKLWSIGRVELGGKPVAWAGAVNWIDAPDPICDAKVETFSAVFVAGPDGKPVALHDGQDHRLPLFAVLTDKTGRIVVLASGSGEYTAYDYANGQATVGRHLVWLVPHPDSFDEIERLVPECAP